MFAVFCNGTPNLGDVRVAFNEELMSLIRQPGAHHFEAPGWNLLRDVLCVSQ